jgi:hypothetical protein
MSPTEVSSRFIFIIVIICVFITLICTAFYDRDYTAPEKPSKLTRTYEVITAKRLSELLKQQTLTVDCSSRKIYDLGHIAVALWSNDPKIFFNLTRDIVVYGSPEANASKFCTDLTGHFYGKIYYFIGGYTAWGLYDQSP